MFELGEKMRYFVCQRPVSMRYGIRGLTNLVMSWPGYSPMSGDVFIFFSADRHQVKVLRWDSDGFLLYQKKLAKGRFRELAQNGSEGCSALSYADLYFLMRGLTPVNAHPEKRFRTCL